MTWGATPISASRVATVRRMSWSVQPYTLAALSRAALLLDQPLKEEFGLPLAAKSKPEFVTAVCVLQINNAAVSPMGNVCSLPFFVTLAGRVIVHRSVEEIVDDERPEEVAPFEDGKEFGDECIHEDCRAAISPLRCPVSAKSFTITPNVRQSSAAIHTRFSSSSVSTRALLLDCPACILATGDTSM